MVPNPQVITQQSKVGHPDPRARQKNEVQWTNQIDPVVELQRITAEVKTILRKKDTQLQTYEETDFISFAQK